MGTALGEPWGRGRSQCSTESCGTVIKQTWEQGRCKQLVLRILDKGTGICEGGENVGREVGGSDGLTSHFLVTIELERLYPCLFTLCVASSVMCPVTVFTHLKKKMRCLFKIDS